MGDLYLVLAFVLAASTRKFDLSFWFSCYKVIKCKKLDIPRHTTECIWKLLEGDHFLLRNIQIQFCGIGRL